MDDRTPYCGECHQFQVYTVGGRTELNPGPPMKDYHLYHTQLGARHSHSTRFRCQDCKKVVVPLLPKMVCPMCGGMRLEVDGNNKNRFVVQLESVDVDVDALRETLRMCGIYPLIRPLCWQLLLGYLPPEVELRAKSLDLQRQRYNMWSAQHFRTYNLASMVADEKSLLHQISVDVPRTHCRAYPWLFPDPRMQESLTRLLYVFAAIFPGVSYFQGLNEVPIPFYVAYLSNGSGGDGSLLEQDFQKMSDEKLRQVEADVFWSLALVMEPVFRATKAEVQKIHAVDQMHWEIEVMQQADPELCEHLSQLGVDFMFFAFRWNVMFLLREFANMDVLLYLFDTYILEEGENGFTSFHVYVACALLSAFRAQLLKMSDTTDALLFLQALPTEDWTQREIKNVIVEAFLLRQKFPSNGVAVALKQKSQTPRLLPQFL